MPTDLLTLLGAGADFVNAAILIYAAYWAFNIRRSLAVKLYRSQALGVGLVAAFSALDATGFGLGFFLSGLTFGGFIVLTIQSLWFLLLFYFVDVSALAARRSDPLLRDSLQWTSLRGPLWVANVAAFFVNEYYRLPIEYVITLAAGVLVLPLAARRSGDLTFRNHLRWFGTYVFLFAAAFGALLLFVIFAVSGLIPAENPGSSPFSFFAGSLFIAFAWGSAYSLYRSARSLVPLNRLSMSD